MTPNDPNLIDMITSVITRLDPLVKDVEWLTREAKEISAQTKLTNGRVTQLEMAQIRREAIDAYREQEQRRESLSRLTLFCALLSGPLSAALAVFLTLQFT